MHVRGEPLLRFNGGEVLHVIAQDPAQILDEPVEQRGEVQRIPGGTLVVVGVGINRCAVLADPAVARAGERDQGGACGAAGPVPASASGLGEAPADARRAARHVTTDQSGTPDDATEARTVPSSPRSIVPLAAAVSRSFPAVASHAIGFAEPRHGTRSPGFGACGKDGED
jgi:hypothetical protein